MAFLIFADARAATLRVPGDHLRIQQALDAAAPGDTVRVAAGIFTGAGNRDLVIEGKTIALIGAGPASTLIDCEGGGRGLSLIGAGAGTLLRGFTVQNGIARGGDLPGKGGGIYCAASEARIERCHFRGGVADFGGGIAAEWEAHPLLVGCVFLDNHAHIEGDDFWSFGVYEESGSDNGSTAH